MWQKEKLLVLSIFFFCHNAFKKLSGAEASESVYTRERVTVIYPVVCFEKVSAYNNYVISGILAYNTDKDVKTL